MAQVRGLRDIKSALRQLPAKMQQNVVASGNRAVATAVVKEVRASGGDVPSTVVRAVMSGPARHRRTTRAFIVGLRKPFSRLSHWFEYGTGPRWQKTTGRYAGRMPATPWLRPALEAVAARAEQIWAKAASRNLDRQLRKIGK